MPIKFSKQIIYGYVNCYDGLVLDMTKGTNVQTHFHHAIRFSWFKTAFEGFEKCCFHSVTWSIERCGHGACAQNWPLWYCMNSSFYTEALKVMTVSAKLQMLWISSQMTWCFNERLISPTCKHSIVSFMTCNWYIMLIFKWCWYSGLNIVDVNDVTVEYMHS